MLNWHEKIELYNLHINKERQGDSMSEVSVKSLNCPNCGAQLDITQKTTDIVFCSSCGSRCVISGLTHNEESPAENPQQPAFEGDDGQASQQKNKPVFQKPDSQQAYNQQYESPQKGYNSSSTGYSNSKSDKGKTKASIYDLGIISLLLCWFPLLNFPLSIAGIVLAFLGLNKKDTSKGKAVFVMICAVVSFIFAIKVNSAILKPSSNEKSTTVSQQEDTLAEDIAASSEETTTASLPYELVDGMSELQSFYLWIDRTCSEDEIIAVAEMAGFEVKKESDIGFDIVYISASELKPGQGAETWYYSDTDWIRLFFGSDGTISSASYRFINELMTVDYSFSDEEVELKKKIQGILGTGSIEIPEEPFSSREDALRYVIEQ